LTVQAGRSHPQQRGWCSRCVTSGALVTPAFEFVASAAGVLSCSGPVLAHGVSHVQTPPFDRAFSTHYLEGSNTSTAAEATAANATLVPPEQLARSTFDFVTQHMQDANNSLWHWNVSRNGSTPLQRNKVITGQLFALLAFRCVWRCLETTAKGGATTAVVPHSARTCQAVTSVILVCCQQSGPTVLALWLTRLAHTCVFPLRCCSPAVSTTVPLGTQQPSTWP
jgi:hypothetical protein